MGSNDTYLAFWCKDCKIESAGSLHSSGIYIPACPHDSPMRRLLQLLVQIEQHCPCGARPESPVTHPHVTGCLVEEALRLVRSQEGVAPNKAGYIHNPEHEIGTCFYCGGEMVYNVPRMGSGGGLIHKDTGKFECDGPVIRVGSTMDFGIV